MLKPEQRQSSFYLYKVHSYNHTEADQLEMIKTEDVFNRTHFSHCISVSYQLERVNASAKSVYVTFRVERQ